MHIRFARRVVNRRRSFSHHGGHHDIGRTGHGRLVEKHIATAQGFALNAVKTGSRIEVEPCAQFLESDKMGIETAAADLVTTRFGNIPFAEPCQQRPDNHHRSAQAGRTLPVIFTLQVAEIDLTRLERIGILGRVSDFHPHLLKQLDQLQNIDNCGHIAHRYLLRGQQRGTQNLQRFVFGPLRSNFAVQRRPAFYFECSHIELYLIFSVLFSKIKINTQCTMLRTPFSHRESNNESGGLPGLRSRYLIF